MAFVVSVESTSHCNYEASIHNTVTSTVFILYPGEELVVARSTRTVVCLIAGGKFYETASQL